jgi:transposase
MIRRDALSEYVRGSLWVLPTLSVLAAGSLLSEDSVGPHSPLAFQGTSDDARALLIGIAGTMVTVIALLLGLTVVALGWSRGGLTTKIHLLADSGCRPLARVTSAGQRHDSLAFLPLMDRLKVARRGPGQPRTRPGRVLGDKAYSSSVIRAHLRRRGIEATIPEPAGQARNRLRRGSKGGRPPAFDAAAYRQRNTVERAFCKLRHRRAVATRYDKRDFVWRGTVDVASIRIWLRDPSHDLRDTL